ncbi:MAG: phage tail spike protein [Clostridium perfringens]|nr:phage tail spike protein [Clostridium perfringens]
MIELRDKDKNRVAGLVDYENLCIESVLDSGDKTLSFYYPKKGKYYDEIVEEAYIRTKKDEFVVKAREIDDDYSKFECSLNLEELEGNIFDRFESIEQTITLALNLAIAGTGWTVKDNTLKKRRTVRCTNKSSLEIVREIKKVYRVDIVFNTLRKQIEVYEHLGEDKGTYFIDSLNLIALQIQSDSRQYATRIIAEGKDGLSFSDINNGKNYVENYQYSNKIKTIYWKDERYTIKENLLEDARAKLEELSKPFRSYSASIVNLAELNPRYSSILDFKLGDAINLISKKNKIKDKQRIVKTIEWPQDHTKDSVELANATLKFEDIQQENQETTDTVNNITTDNGTINGSTIDSIQVKQIENFEANVLKVTKLEVIEASINHLSVIKADIQDLNVVKANIGTLEATKADITELNSVRADLKQAIIGKANITDLNAAVGKINVLESKTASIENALLGNLTAENFKANSITATSGIIAEGAIGSAQISSLSLNKLEAGDITTSKHRIVSADGTIEIVGNQILINRNNVNRVILGEYRKQDNTTEYGLLIRGKDGRTVMFDSDGVHNAGITDGAIDNNKVADNANISGNKLDINSVIREVNNNGTETIKGTKVTVGDRTLDVELSTQKNTITENSKELSSQKTSITALDNALKLKVDSQAFTQSTQTINNNIDLAKNEVLNILDWKIASEEQKRIQQVQDNLNIAKNYTNAEITTVNTNLNRATSEINVLKEKIESKVSQVDIDKSINKVVIGGRNLVLNREDFKFTSSNYDGTDILKKGIIEINNTSRRFRVSGYLQRYLSEKLDNSKPYCISLDLKANGESKNLYLSFYYRGANSPLYAEGVRVSDINNVWRRFTIKMHPNENSNTDVLELVFNSMSKDCGVTRIEYRNLKIEEGTMPTADSEAPEDSKKLIVDSIKVVTDKISTVESNFTQENNNIKASVQNLNSTTQTITTNVSNINRNLTSRINSNLDVAKNFATSKATEALNNAKAFVNAEITTVNTKVHNLESNITILTDRINSKVSQSDIDRSITTVDNKIKIVDSKISDVSSSVTQLRDSVTTDIRAINSKTHSIETNLNGKATKQEVTEVNNRVTIIKASLDGITQRISATESKTQTLETTINGKASKQEVNNVSSKVVSLEANLNGITNRVSSTESRINTLNGQVQNAATKHELTEFKQSTRDFQWKVEQGLAGNNLLRNSGFLNGYSHFYVTEYQWNGVNSSVNVWGDSSEWVMTGTNALVIRGTNGNRGAYGVRQDQIKLKPNTTYTLSGYAAVHRGTWRISLAQNDWGWIASSRGKSSGGKNPNNWDRFSITFTTGPAYDYLTNCKLDLMLEEAQNDAYVWFTNLVLNEGSIADKWQQFNNELYTSDMSFDTNGLYCSFSDGSHSSMGKDGFEWFNAGTGHSYHALAYVTSFGIPAGNPGRAYVRLPVEFTKRRKSLKWTIALRGYYYSTSGNFFPMHVHASGTEEYEENGILVCPVEGYCKIQNAQNSSDIQFRPVTAMLIAVA